MRHKELFEQIASDFRSARVYTLDGGLFRDYDALLGEWRAPPESPKEPRMALFYDGRNRRVVAAPLSAHGPLLHYLDFNCFCHLAYAGPPMSPGALCRAHLKELAIALLDDSRWVSASDQEYLRETLAFIERMESDAAFALAREQAEAALGPSI